MLDDLEEDIRADSVPSERNPQLPFGHQEKLRLINSNSRKSSGARSGLVKTIRAILSNWMSRKEKNAQKSPDKPIHLMVPSVSSLYRVLNGYKFRQRRVPVLVHHRLANSEEVLQVSYDAVHIPIGFTVPVLEPIRQKSLNCVESAHWCLRRKTQQRQRTAQRRHGE